MKQKDLNLIDHICFAVFRRTASWITDANSRDVSGMPEAELGIEDDEVYIKIEGQENSGLEKLPDVGEDRIFHIGQDFILSLVNKYFRTYRWDNLEAGRVEEFLLFMVANLDQFKEQVDHQGLEFTEVVDTDRECEYRVKLKEYEEPEVQQLER